MKLFLIIMLIGFFTGHSNGQIIFSPVDSKLRIVKKDNMTELICSNSPISFKFSLKRGITSTEQENFVSVDSQIIQLLPLTFTGFKNDGTMLEMNDQKQLLDIYSKYELDYFRNELKVEVINPNNQWVLTNSRGWFIWYFRVGSMPVEVDKKMWIQLYASTIIGNKILTINAPIETDGDFRKAGIIVNEMMETLAIEKD